MTRLRPSPGLRHEQEVPSDVRYLSGVQQLAQLSAVVDEAPVRVLMVQMLLQ